MCPRRRSKPGCISRAKLRHASPLPSKSSGVRVSPSSTPPGTGPTASARTARWCGRCGSPIGRSTARPCGLPESICSTCCAGAPPEYRMDDFWGSRRILVTGGTGFLGSYVVEKLRQRCVQEVFAPTREEYDLRVGAAVDQMCADLRPHVVIHLAAVVGGIGANGARPGEFF